MASGSTPSSENSSFRRFIAWTSIVDDSRFDSQQFVHLWMVALGTYGVGDIVTTITLIWFTQKVNELNALVLFVFDAFGLAGFVGLKFVVFIVSIGITLIGARSDDAFLYYLPPFTLSVIGGFVTAINIRLFLG